VAVQSQSQRDITGNYVSDVKLFNEESDYSESGERHRGAQGKLIRDDIDLIDKVFTDGQMTLRSHSKHLSTQTFENSDTSPRRRVVSCIDDEKRRIGNYYQTDSHSRDITDDENGRLRNHFEADAPSKNMQSKSSF